MADGIVLSIHRFSIDSGPGIRTKVRLKGCGMRCAWCDTPEGIAPGAELCYDDKRCIACARCQQQCPDVHRFEHGVHSLHRDNCFRCGRCEGVCPAGALVLMGKRMRHEDVLDIVLRDKRYYDESGGGLMLSGGEPTDQLEFSRAILSGAKNAGIQTAIETSGNALINVYTELMPITDLFFVDYKLSDPAKAQVYTGAESYIQRSNIRALAMLGANTVVRCPIIPGVNDNDEHFRAIAELSLLRGGMKGYEILPYNARGETLARQLGIKDRQKFELPDDLQLVQWKARINEFGGRSYE